ncbi:hypothetical protein OIE71_30465 [Streptomyces sp. NBC_01725]|uniref:hypothetical protein n=1 Tax=Streptomyces sp. NBC_01725 TaxID=2975923 RepID=UPI002E29043E|nr:hypothetical protein [Streptomyces sp. NBC_01725]
MDEKGYSSQSFLFSAPPGAAALLQVADTVLRLASQRSAYVAPADLVMRCNGCNDSPTGTFLPSFVGTVLPGSLHASSMRLATASTPV